MEEVLPLVEDEEYLSSILSDHLKWIYSLTKVEDFTASYYVYNMDMAVVRIEEHLQAIATKKTHFLSMQG